jgi:hypothetical protein
MATKSKPAAKSRTSRNSTAGGKAAQNTPAPSGPAKNGAARDTPAERPRVFARSTVVPALGIGLITALLAAQEHAPFPVVLIVACVVALVVVGMIALKRAFYGD